MIQYGHGIFNIKSECHMTNQSFAPVPKKPAPDEASFWNKIKVNCKKMGKEVALLAIQLWLVMKDSNTSVSIKIAIGSALAYLVLPVDAIPDFIPVAGYTDDLAALGAVVKLAGGAMTEQHKQEAERIYNDF